MAKKLETLAKKLKNITVEQQLEELKRIFQKYEPEILEFNKQQLLKGLDSQGRSLGEYANERYAAMKRLLNPNGVVDLKLDGNFHDNFFLVNELPIIIWSYDEKTDFLVAKYGENLFGVTAKDKEQIIKEFIIDEFIRYQRKLLGLR